MNRILIVPVTNHTVPHVPDPILCCGRLRESHPWYRGRPATGTLLDLSRDRGLVLRQTQGPSVPQRGHQPGQDQDQQGPQHCPQRRRSCGRRGNGGLDLDM